MLRVVLQKSQRLLECRRFVVRDNCLLYDPKKFSYVRGIVYHRCETHFFVIGSAGGEIADDLLPKELFGIVYLVELCSLSAGVQHGHDRTSASLFNNLIREIGQKMV